MSDKKITELDLATPEETDVIPFVDISDTTMGLSGTTKKATKADLKGEKGDNATVDVGTTTTGNAGTNASVVNSGTTQNAVFDFTIPRGDKGDTGDAGACVESVAFVGNDMVFTLDDASTATLVGAKTALKGDTGEAGDDAYVYIAYASDDTGTDFTTTFNPLLDYIAIKNTTTAIPSPSASDFTGLWKNYKGQKGDTGDTGAKPISVAFSGNNMVFVLEDSSTITLTNAKIDLKGDKGDTGKGITSIVKTGTLGLIDTYTITYSDSTTSTFDITNGAKGDKGDKGDIGPQGIQGIQGIQGNPGTNGIDGTDGISLTPKGAYNALTEYVANDVVSYLGSTWIALQTTTGNTPQESVYWTLNASKGTDGEGNGDMLASVYDPTNVAGDAFDMDNMVEGTNNKLVSAAEKSGWSGKQDALGFTPEDIANKKTDLTDNSDTYYPSQKAVKTAVDAKQDSLGFTPENVANKVTSFQATPDDTHYPSEKLVKDSLDGKASLASPTFTGTVTTPAIKITTGAGLGKVLTSDADGDATWETSVSADSTTTLTNKRITPRITTITSHATPTINTDNCDAVTITAQAEAITSMTTNLSGTPTNFQKLIIRIKDNGTARAITWGASFEAKGVALPTTTVISKVLTVGFIYDTVTSKWGCVAVSQEA